MSANQCAACGQFFKPWPQTPGQTFCSNPECQRERRRFNKQKHRNTNRSQISEQNKAWAAEHPDYWKQYRETHPEYTERNRAQQRQRNRRRQPKAGLDTGTDQPLPPGRYLLTPLGHP